jgi:DNA-binding transcriptional LysR family regulator
VALNEKYICLNSNNKLDFQAGRKVEKMDKLRALHYFLKVVETSNFTQAAKAFGVPVSSMSRRIKDLETMLGVELFQRSTRVVRLTEQGLLYYDEVKGAVATLNHADELVSLHTKIPSGTLRITATPGYGEACLTPVLAKFRQQYPDITLDIHLTDQVTDLTRDQIDIAIREGGEPEGRVVSRKLSGNKFLLVASPKYLDTHGVPQNLAQLSSHRVLYYRGPNAVLFWQVNINGEWLQLQNKANMISNHGAGILKAVVGSEGIALLPEWGLKEELSTKQLQVINLSDAQVMINTEQDAGIYLLYVRPKYQLQKVKVAVDFLIKELRVD